MAHVATATKKGYRVSLQKPNDRKQIPNTDRNRFWRWISLIGFGGLMFVGPLWLVHWWGSMIGFPIIGALIGVGIGGYIASKLIPDRFLVNNLEWTAFVTQSMFGGGMVPYGPGLHPAYPWEERSKEGNYPLTVVTRSFQTSIATSTSKVIIGGEYEYAMSLRHITLAIGIDETTIEEGLTAFISSFLISECSKQNEDGTSRDAEWVRSHSSELNEALANEFMERESGGENPDSFEARFGFVTVTIVINSITFPDDVQKTRDAIDEAITLHKVVAGLYGMPPEVLAERIKTKEISVKDYNTMLNRAMASSGNAKMNVQVLEADIPALISKLAENFGGNKS